MKIIKGFSNAKQVLSRVIPADFSDPFMESEEQAKDAGTSIKITVEEIIRNVRQNGDNALFEYARKFDDAELNSLLVTEDEINHAYQQVDKELLSALKLAAKRITEFHSNSKKSLE
ncbi:MAG: histidinol dehydrogenase, partial [Dehalococcoidia bacterium]